MSLNPVLLLLLVNFVSRDQVGIDVSLIVSLRSGLTHLHGFQLLVLPPEFIEILFVICANRINLLNLKESSGRLVIIAKVFLKLPHLDVLINQKSLSLPRNMALGTFVELLIVFSTKVN